MAKIGTRLLILEGRKERRKAPFWVTSHVYSAAHLHLLDTTAQPQTGGMKRALKCLLIHKDKILLSWMFSPSPSRFQPNLSAKFLVAAQRCIVHYDPFPCYFLRCRKSNFTLYWNSKLVVISLATDGKTFGSAYWHWQNVKRPTVQAQQIWPTFVILQGSESYSKSSGKVWHEPIWSMIFSSTSQIYPAAFIF